MMQWQLDISSVEDFSGGKDKLDPEGNSMLDEGHEFRCGLTLKGTEYHVSVIHI